MSVNKLCAIFSVASHYREVIYRKIDANYDCDWFFSNEKTDVKLLDLSLLKSVSIKSYKKLFGSLYLIKGIQTLLCEKKYDAYLVINSPLCPSVWLFLLRAKLFYPRKKIFLWGHGWYGRENFLKKIIKRLMLNASTGVFVYGEYAKCVAESYGCNGSKIFPIHNSLDYDKQLSIRNKLSIGDIYKSHFNNINPTIIFIGRLAKSKKLEQLIEVLAILRNRGHRYNLVLIGDGEARNNLEDTASKLNIREFVWFYGACYDEFENANLIYNADLCVSPGNVGLTAVHSMMFGTPVITHNNFPYQGPEFETIRSGETGDFFHQNDIDDLCVKILHWFEHHGNDRDSVRRECFRVIDYDWNPNFQIELIKSVIK